MILAALVLALGGTAEEADAIALRIGSHPNPTKPSQSVALVQAELDRLRYGKPEVM